MIGVTIGVGVRFRDLARSAADAARRHYHLDHVVILGEPQLHRWCPGQDRFPDFPKRVFWLKFCVPLILPGVDRWMYLDADYTAQREPPADVLDQIHHDPRLIAVEDWWPTHPYPWPYRNAGWYVVNRERHDALFTWCRENYWSVPETFGEQCVWNAGMSALGVDVLELPREYNAGKPCENPIGKHGYW